MLILIPHAVSEEKSTVVVARFSFKATVKRKKILNASKEINESREGRSLPVCFLDSQVNHFGQNLFGFGNQLS